MVQENNKFLFGTAYYDEYQPVSNLDQDLTLMQEAHMNVIRVGEGSWSHWEPEDGKFELDWLKPVLDKALEKNIKAIIGVPTFAVPQWLVRKYPEIALHDSDGNARFFGSREEHRLSHPVFKYYSERLITKIVERYADHPAVIGWQLHNEPGLFLNYSDDAFEGFKDYLKNKYVDVKKLNKEWGLTYWSHELSTWDDLWKPEGNAQSQYDIEWRRYQAKLTDDLLASQRNLIKSIAPSYQFITVNFDLGRPALDEIKSGKHLDVASTDIYYYMQNGMSLPDYDKPKNTWFKVGPTQIAMQADRSYSVKQMPYYVAETNGGPVGGAGDNFPAFNGQIRQAAWQFIARGAEMIEYWQWQQLHYGTEMYWGSVLPHDRKPGRIYQEIAKLGSELENAGEKITNLKPDFDITILYSVDSRWGLSFEPYTSDNSLSDPHKIHNEKAFDHMLSAFYEGAFISGRQVNFYNDSQIVDEENEHYIQDPKEFVKTHPNLVVAGVYITSNTLLAWLNDYVNNGGHLILGPRSTYADSLARARMETKPSLIDEIAKTYYQEFTNLRKPLHVHGVENIKLRENSYATEWADYLIDDGSEILAEIDDANYGKLPVITTNKVNNGQVTMIATVPNADLAASLYDYVLPQEEWVTGHETITHSSATNGNGEKIHFIFNWSNKEVNLNLPVTCLELNSGQIIDNVLLKPWDVSILTEEK